MKTIRTSLVVVSILLVLNFIFSAKPFLYHFYSVKNLTEIFYESKRNRHQFSGAICNDGWVSHSQGRGTCSWHGGVNYYFYKGEYIKSKEECREDAKEFSWVE
ncbi:MAG: hypothetical protein ACK50E_03555 [Bacteroidota bacterium]